MDSTHITKLFYLKEVTRHSLNRNIYTQIGMGIEATAPLTTTWFPLNDNLLSWQYEGQILELGVCGLNPIYKCLAQYARDIQKTVKK
jgi:hypothetical protein